MGLIRAAWCVLRLLLLPRGQLAVENLALRQQLAALSRQRPRPRLRRRDRLFWVLLSGWFGEWRSCLAIVKPDTVIGCHRQGFRLYWRWKYRGGKLGRPTIAREVVALIHRTAHPAPVSPIPT